MFQCFVLIVSSHNVHLRKIKLPLSHAKQLRFKKTDTGKAPAGTGTGLVLHSSDPVLFDHLKLIRTLRHEPSSAQEQEKEKKHFFHENCFDDYAVQSLPGAGGPDRKS